ncbi:MAG: glycosyltransferase family 4 protein [Bdellovibrionota bacterium]
MRILYVTDSFPPESVGGAGQVVFDMAKGMIANGQDVSVLSATTKKENAGAGIYEGISVRRIFSSQKPQFFRSYLAANNPFIKKEFQEIVDELRLDVVDFDNVHEHFSFAALKWARSTGATVFITLHDTLSFSYTRLYHFIDLNNVHQKGPLNYRVPLRLSLQQMGKSFNPFRNSSIRRSLRSSNTIFSVSNALKDALNQNGIHNVETLYNGIDPTSFISTFQEEQLLRSRLNIGSRPVILFGGRAMTDKGTEVILEAFSSILQRCPNAALVMALEKGEYQNRLWMLAQKLRVEHSLVLIDLLHGRERAALFSMASLVVVPSIYFDPAPLMAMQALAAGKPVVGTCFGGTPEIVMDEETGYIVNPYDITALADRISKLLVDPARAETMGKAGQSRILEKFTLKHQIDRVMLFYKKAALSEK